MAEKTQEQDQEQDQWDEELQSPEFIDNRIDVKAATVVTLDYVLRSIRGEQEENPLKFSILTPFGVVGGQIVKGAAENDVATQIFQQAMDIRNDQLQRTIDDLDGEPVIVNNAGAILIKNASITPYANPSKIIQMEHMYLFTDQITGITANL